MAKEVSKDADGYVANDSLRQSTDGLRMSMNDSILAQGGQHKSANRSQSSMPQVALPSKLREPLRLKYKN